MSPEPAAADAAPSPKRTGKRLLWLALFVLLLSGGGGGAYWYFVFLPQRAAAAAPAEGAAPPPEARREGTAALKFDPFVVNLADAGGVRYLRLGLSLVIAASEKDAKEVQENPVKLLRIRSAVLELLSQQTSDHVVTPEGKQALKQAIAEHATRVLAPLEVTDVLFTEFVVQF